MGVDRYIFCCRYKTRGCRGSKTKSNTFYLLLDLIYFFDLFHAEQHDQALDVSVRITLNCVRQYQHSLFKIRFEMGTVKTA